jgi:hypothetical protein
MFLDPSSFAETKVSMEHFREWANSIASSYLTSGTEPTTSLCKIAQSEELTPHQIALVAGEANKLIHQQKYAAAADKYFAADFPHADARAAIASLQNGGSLKVAAVLASPTAEVPDDYDPFGMGPQGEVKTAELKHQFKHTILKTANLQEKLRDRAILTKEAADNAERAFIKEARQAVLSDSNSAERMKTLGGIDHFAKCAGLDAKRQLAKLAYVLSREGLLTQSHAKTALSYFMSKEADCKAPEELISEWLPARVVNGTHPLYITLKTFHDHQGRMDDNRGRSSIVDDKLQILRQKVRAL